jgi:hypothetical protein
MAPPDAGTCSVPVTFGRQIVCKNGPATMRENWYCTGHFLLAGEEPVTGTVVSR